MKFFLASILTTALFCIGCGNPSSKEDGRALSVPPPCLKDCPEEVSTVAGLRRVILDRPHRPNEFAVQLRWPTIPGAQGYRVLRTFVRGGRIGHHPHISTVQQPYLEDSDLLGGSIIVYRVEALNTDDSTTGIDEIKIEIPIDIIWRGQVHSQQIVAAIRNHVLNRITFEKGTVVTLDDLDLSLDAQFITFNETTFVSFSTQTNSKPAGAPQVYGAQGYTGVPGKSGGFLRIRANSIRGTAQFILNGEDGGTGGTGFGGAPGNDGGGGDISCSQRRGTDGAPGGNGGSGGAGGSTGRLYIEAGDASTFHYAVTGKPGAGGKGGLGGAGGLRGVGKTVYCGLGTLGAPLTGYAGNSGASGAEGGAGVSGQRRPICVILGKKISENPEGSCNSMLSQKL